MSSPDAQQGLSTLRALLAPAVRQVTLTAAPRARRSVCPKCPFGGPALTPGEALQAEGVKQRLRDNPTTAWGCHETADTGKVQLCAGWLAWRDKEGLE